MSDLSDAEKIALDYVRKSSPAMTPWPLDVSDPSSAALQKLADRGLITVEQVAPGFAIGVATAT